MLPTSVSSQSPWSPQLRSQLSTATGTPCHNPASPLRGCGRRGSCVSPALCAAPLWPGRWLVSWRAAPPTPSSRHLPKPLSTQSPRMCQGVAVQRRGGWLALGSWVPRDPETGGSEGQHQGRFRPRSRARLCDNGSFQSSMFLLLKCHCRKTRKCG